MKKKALIYIHGKGGNSSEAKQYIDIFSDYDVIGFDYKSNLPWEAEVEFNNYFDEIKTRYESVSIVANSIGAYFALCSLDSKEIEKAYFVSPILNMERLIVEMMKWAGVTEKELAEKRVICTDFGENLSYDYLSWARKKSFSWKIPTYILYGEFDNLQSFETVSIFSEEYGADITVMKQGEHWFHTECQLDFLKNWILSKIN